MSNKKQTQKGPITTMHKVMVVIVSLLAAFAFGLAFGTVSKSLIIGMWQAYLPAEVLHFYSPDYLKQRWLRSRTLKNTQA